MVLWPAVFITDITTFLMTSEHEEQARIHLNQYKIGKAYEYFASQWLKEVFYHHISPQSTVCFMRARCVPSRRLNLDPHTVWVCCVKKTGEIQSAYCSCTAGLGQTCNHVAGLLFRIEHANTTGLTSCTSSKCVWVTPGKTAPLPPSKLKDMDFKKSQYGKKRRASN
ncbi:uncharacterized protein LOC110466736 [Mizuhopecten yessoensis]|uniref:uncharacterized protein LOC110466736 n=1 Tax=Mizuhopecten yessoensis TaxID=6573 RepID=UPI000B45F110|nr:uncharacterized protein LOC110466736 [Mizuhopecten yessoensis]